MLTHVNPDGDALGSLLGLALGLESLGIRTAPLCADPVPAIYRFLPGAERIASDFPAQPPMLAIAVDSDGRSRVGRLALGLERVCTTVDIDHHATEKAFGDVQWVDPRAAATGEMVYRLLRAMDVAVSPDIATCLYTAILTDTGRFCYSNTSPRVLRIAAALVRAGANPQRIYREVYESKSFSASRLLGLALGRLSQTAEGGVIFSTLTQDDFRSAGSTPDETEGIIDHLRAVRQARAAALFVALPDGGVRVSLRSQGAIDVGEVALRFGGGGHTNAAGCTVPGPMPQAQDRVLPALVEALSRE
ncbi:MAG: bifunctional oligoribonuclease/PAP phosphatase NrnA [Armatimonadota bacterium]|nr:MAG: bifunctional oligoribonuclease/PAP phosphatase NrnA [Armatimonadota bacterium]